MKTHRLMLVALVAVVAVAVAPQAQACDGYGYGYGYGYLYNSLDYNVPYFAAHPPVYYSYPVPRTYGYSPFAYPPHVMTPDVVDESSVPVQIINPYVPSSSGEQTKPEADKTADSAGQPQPLVIINPFVTAKGSIAQAE
jgi:hypothetical protein